MQKSVLIAEDEKEIREILATKLRDSNFSVRTCEDGEACMTMIEESSPDILLLDIIMPKKTGLELIKELSFRGLGKDIPIIILSNKSDYVTQHEAEHYGVKLYLTKAETSLEDVVKRINEVLG